MSDMHCRPTMPRVSSESEQSTTTCEHAWRRMRMRMRMRLGLGLGPGPGLGLGLGLLESGLVESGLGWARA